MSEIDTTMVDALAAAESYNQHVRPVLLEKKQASAQVEQYPEKIDKLMIEDASRVDLQSEFEAIIQLKQDLARETGELEKEMALLLEKINVIEEPYLAAIQGHEEVIKKEILECGKTFKCCFGQAVYRKGPRSVKWNDEALMGYSAAGHPEIEQFRTETEGKPSVTIKMGGMA